MRRIPTAIVRWIRSFLHQRTTRLLFNGAKSDTINTPTCIPQGSPLSPLLYMCYNAELLEVQPKDNHNTNLSLSFIDDVVYGAEGTSARSNVWRLRQMLQGADEWRQRDGAKFETSKDIVIHFTHNQRQPTDHRFKRHNQQHCHPPLK
jgi:Reverse transcriptase (RNA-dependent DNA polymerase)